MKKIILSKKHLIFGVLFAFTLTFTACGATGDLNNTTNTTIGTTRSTTNTTNTTTSTVTTTTNPTTNTTNTTNTTTPTTTTTNPTTNTTNSTTSTTTGTTSSGSSSNNDSQLKATNLSFVQSSMTTLSPYKNSDYITGILTKYQALNNNIPCYNPNSNITIKYILNNYTTKVNTVTTNQETKKSASYEKLTIEIYKSSIEKSNLIISYLAKDFEKTRLKPEKYMTCKYTFRAPSKSGSYLIKSTIIRNGDEEVYYDYFNVK